MYFVIKIYLTESKQEWIEVFALPEQNFRIK